jgi:hypothetical protein
MIVSKKRKKNLGLKTRPTRLKPLMLLLLLLLLLLLPLLLSL